MLKIMPIIGTRPEGIKKAPVIKALQMEEGVDCVFVNTAQHREMLDQVLDLFRIVPDYDLDSMKKGQTILLTTHRRENFNELQSIYEECSKLLGNPLEYAKMIEIKNPFGDGNTAKKIIKHIKTNLFANEFQEQIQEEKGMTYSVSLSK